MHAKAVLIIICNYSYAVVTREMKLFQNSVLFQM